MLGFYKVNPALFGVKQIGFDKLMSFGCKVGASCVVMLLLTASRRATENIPINNS
jgi:hypothetical protein